MSHDLKHAISHTGGKTTSGLGAEDMSRMAASFSGEDHVPDVPSMGLLTLLTAIRKADTDISDCWSPMIDNELRHLKAAVHLLTTNPQIQYKFGSSMEGAMQLVGIIKARASELDVTKMIDPVISTMIEPGLASHSFIKPSKFVTLAAAARRTMRKPPASSP